MTAGDSPDERDAARYVALAEQYEKALEYYAGVRGHPVSGVRGRDSGQVARAVLAAEKTP